MVKNVNQKIYSYQSKSCLVFLDTSFDKEGNNICHVATSWMQGLFPLNVICNRHHHHHGLGIKRRGKLMFIFLKFTLIFDLVSVKQQKKFCSYSFLLGFIMSKNLIGCLQNFWLKYQISNLFLTQKRRVSTESINHLI